MVRRQTLVAGVVLLLGVAVALCGFTLGGKPGRNGGANIGSSNMSCGMGRRVTRVGELRIGLWIVSLKRKYACEGGSGQIAYFWCV